MHSSTIQQKSPEVPSEELQPHFSTITKTFIAPRGIVIPHERKSCFGDFFKTKKTSIFYYVYLIGEKAWNVKNAGHVVD